MSRKKVDWAKYHNRHNSKSIWVTRLLFFQNDSLITHILFELCLLWCLAQSTFFLDTLYQILQMMVWCSCCVFLFISTVQHLNFFDPIAWNARMKMTRGRMHKNVTQYRGMISYQNWKEKKQISEWLVWFLT